MLSLKVGEKRLFGMFGLLLLRQPASEFVTDGLGDLYFTKKTKLFKRHIRILQFLKVIFTISISILLAKQARRNKHIRHLVETWG